MEQVKKCMEHIKVIRGVSKGLISNEQIQHLITIYQLNAEQEKELFQVLKEKHICPIPECEFPDTGFEKTKIQKMEVEQKSNQEKEENGLIDDRELFFRETLFFCYCNMVRKPSLITQYQEEMPLLINSIVIKGNVSKNPVKNISYAVMEISRYRVRDIRKKGWVCGTYMRRKIERFRRWIGILFTEEELKELILACRDADKLSDWHKKMLLILLHNTPETLVHMRLAKYFES